MSFIHVVGHSPIHMWRHRWQQRHHLSTYDVIDEMTSSSSIIHMRPSSSIIHPSMCGAIDIIIVSREFTIHMTSSMVSPSTMYPPFITQHMTSSMVSSSTIYPSQYIDRANIWRHRCYHRRPFINLHMTLSYPPCIYPSTMYLSTMYLSTMYLSMYQPCINQHMTSSMVSSSTIYQRQHMTSSIVDHSSPVIHPSICDAIDHLSARDVIHPP